MLYQDFNNIPLMPLELRLTPPILTQPSPIVLQRNLDERMNLSGWFQPQPPLLPGPVSVELLNRNLWQEFFMNNTEMIITKSGRRMFPSIQINVSGLQKRENYYVALEIVPASDHRHKYCGYENENRSDNMGGWSNAGPADPQQSFERRTYVHPDSPAIGEHWMDNTINFNKLKLTNNINDKNNMILSSMHKYVPKIWIIRCNNASNICNLFCNPAKSFVFEETAFIAVTAYQNENITKLKIDNNPFAKGFRETGQSRFKRKYQHDQRAQPGSSRAHDEGSNTSFSDSESNRVSSERSSVASNAEMQESAKRLAVENNADNDACDNVGPIAMNRPLVPITANSRSASNAENDHNEIVFHRPWLDSPPRRRVVPSSHRTHNRPSLHHQYSNTPYMNNIRNHMRFPGHDYQHPFPFNSCYHWPWWTWYYPKILLK